MSVHTPVRIHHQQLQHMKVAAVADMSMREMDVVRKLVNLVIHTLLEVRLLLIMIHTDQKKAETDMIMHHIWAAVVRTDQQKVLHTVLVQLDHMEQAHHTHQVRHQHLEEHIPQEVALVTRPPLLSTAYGRRAQLVDQLSSHHLPLTQAAKHQQQVFSSPQLSRSVDMRLHHQEQQQHPPNRV